MSLSTRGQARAPPSCLWRGPRRVTRAGPSRGPHRESSRSFAFDACVCGLLRLLRPSTSVASSRSLSEARLEPSGCLWWPVVACGCHHGYEDQYGSMLRGGTRPRGVLEGSGCARLPTRHARLLQACYVACLCGADLCARSCAARRRVTRSRMDGMRAHALSSRVPARGDSVLIGLRRSHARAAWYSSWMYALRRCGCDTRSSREVSGSVLWRGGERRGVLSS